MENKRLCWNVERTALYPENHSLAVELAYSEHDSIKPEHIALIKPEETKSEEQPKEKKK